MCGLAGALVVSGAPIEAEHLVAMRDRMVHRGPDDAGLWMSSDRRVGLAFRRLSIIDLSPQANQPMSDADETIHVIYNGEIYNYRDLWRELEAQGYRFRTDHADTEVLIHGYRCWGIDGLLRRINGMFAFALYDAQRQRLFLVRDRVGVKPLYVTRQGGTVLFASEIKALLAHPLVSRTLSRTALDDYLTFLVAPAPATLFEGIEKIPPGRYVELTLGGECRTVRYWSPLGDGGAGRASDTGSVEDPARMLRDELDRSVRMRLLTDVPIGAFLSGGIDSSAIVTLMARHRAGPIDTFTAAYADAPEDNELEFAAAVARSCGTRHHEVEITREDTFDYLQRMAVSQDEPLADWVCIPLYFLARAARAQSTKVILVGEGSDELFAGYAHYQRYLRYSGLYDAVAGAPLLRLGARLMARGLAAAGRGRPGADAYGDIFRRAGSGKPFFCGGAIAFTETHKRRLFRPGRAERARLAPARGGIVDRDMPAGESADHIARYIEEHGRDASGDDILSLMTYIEFCHRLPELLLMRIDKMTMSESVEARVPFLDYRIVEQIVRLPMAQKIPNYEPKHLLKRALAGIVPDSTLSRPKKGFGAPMSRWMRGQPGRMLRDLVLDSGIMAQADLDQTYVRRLFDAHIGGERDYAVFLWALVNLALWYETWMRPSSAAADPERAPLSVAVS